MEDNTRTRLIAQAVYDLEKGFNFNKAQNSMFSDAKSRAENSIIKYTREMQELLKEFERETLLINSRIENLKNLQKILVSCKGYLRTTQHSAFQLNIRGGFTAVEELVNFHKVIEFFTSRPMPTFGTYVYEVQDNGLLELVDSKVDSSD